MNNINIQQHGIKPWFWSSYSTLGTICIHWLDKRKNMDLVWIWRVVIVNRICKYMQFTELIKIQKTFSIPEMDKKTHTHILVLSSFLLSNNSVPSYYGLLYNPKGVFRISLVIGKSDFEFKLSHSKKSRKNLNRKWTKSSNLQNRIRRFKSYSERMKKMGFFVAHTNVNL